MMPTKCRRQPEHVANRHLRRLERPQQLAIGIITIGAQSQRFRNALPIGGKPRIISDRPCLTTGVKLKLNIGARRAPLFAQAAHRHHGIDRGCLDAAISDTALRQRFQIERRGRADLCRACTALCRKFNRKLRLRLYEQDRVRQIGVE